MISRSNIRIADYNYILPQDRIAKFPLSRRDQSKLLIYNKGVIKTALFKDLPHYVPQNTLMVFNDTRVIQARLLFHKPTGAKIEVFCLEPYHPMDMQAAFQKKAKTTWKCFIGNARRWKSGDLVLGNKRTKLKARLIEKQGNTFVVEFSWNPPHMTFAEVMDVCGLVPLPPYLNREPVENDKTTYQTVYASHEGSVAAPTAGLHFTDDVFHELHTRLIRKEYVTLHVGAGTFKPVVSETIDQHEMHFERISVKRQTIEELMAFLDKPIMAVGTTSVRTLESLYWFGVKLKVAKAKINALDVEQWDPYKAEYNTGLSARDALAGLLEWMDENQMQDLSGSTQLMIVPGYDYRIVKGMVTNFHLPKSTLLLLVAAFIGKDWKSVYEHALNSNYRFLSYGDSCLFIR